MAYEDYSPERVEECIREAKAMRARVVGEIVSSIAARTAALLREFAGPAKPGATASRAKPGGARPAPSL